MSKGTEQALLVIGLLWLLSKGKGKLWPPNPNQTPKE